METPVFFSTYMCVLWKNSAGDETLSRWAENFCYLIINALILYSQMQQNNCMLNGMIHQNVYH